MFRNGLQIQHILLLALIVLVLFGANRLPDVAKNVGKSLKILKEEAKELRGSDAPAPADAATETSDSETTAPDGPATGSTGTPAATPPGEAGSSGR